MCIQMWLRRQNKTRIHKIFAFTVLFYFHVAWFSIEMSCVGGAHPDLL